MKALPGNRRRLTDRASAKSAAEHPDRLRIQEILVPIDFSTASREALIVASQWAQLHDAALHLLYVIEPPTVPQWGYVFLALREGKLRKEAEAQLKTFRRWVPAALPVTLEVRSGYGAEYEICQLAQKRNTDLIVIGSRGASPIRRALMGSTAEQVVRHAPCPVLVVREQVRTEKTSP